MEANWTQKNQSIKWHEISAKLAWSGPEERTSAKQINNPD